MADLSRNRWPVIFGTGGRNPSEQVAEFIGIGNLAAPGCQGMDIPFDMPSVVNFFA